jgi:uncharacterized membrane protein YkvA (DUF1232 family)
LGNEVATMKVEFELGESDLVHFRALFDQMRKKRGKPQEEEILESARELMQSSLESNPPEFVRQRLEGLGKLVTMLEDDAWRLPTEERQRVTEALAYFVAQDDIVPDTVPVLGLLDDAIAAELALRSLAHEISAYDDFSRFRAAEAQRRANQGNPADVSKEDWLADRRATLHSRMREHRLADREGWHTITLFGI